MGWVARRLGLSVLGLGLLGVALSLPLRADGLEHWFIRNGLIACRSQVTSANLMGVVHGVGRYVAWSEPSSDQGNLWSSVDGTLWEQVVGPFGVNAVTFGNGHFLAVGWNYRVWVSNDGQQWESRDSSPMAWATRVTHGEAGFIAYGGTEDGQNWLFESVDGASWQPGQGVNQYYSLAYGNGRYAAVAQWPQSESVATSVWVGEVLDRAITWGHTTIDPLLILPAVAYGNGRYVAVGRHRETGQARIATSTNAKDWTVTELPGHESAALQGIAFGNGQFVAVGDNGLILTSSDGVAWGDGPGPVTEWLQGATWGDHGWVVVGNSGVVYAVDLSTDVPRLDLHLHGAVYAEDRYVVVGEGGKVGVSTDGQDWSVHSLGQSKALLGVTHGATGYLAVGEQGTVLTSADGTSWEPGVSGSEAWLSAVAYGNGQYVAVGDQGTILVSADGRVWAPRDSGTADWLKDVVFAAGRFVAVGGRSLLSSVDGIQWVPRAGLRDLEAVAYGNGLWVAVGGTEDVRKDSGSGMGVAYTSRDGEIWERHKLSSLPWLTDVTYAGGWFVALVGGDIGGVLRSTDGARWEILPVDAVQGLNAITSDGQRAVVVGDLGTILQSGRIEPPDDAVIADDLLDHWHARTPYPTRYDLRRCVYGNGRFVALGSRFERGPHNATFSSEVSILTSADGVHWERGFWDYRPAELRGLAYGSGQFVVVGDEGLMLTSRNGRRWRAVDSAPEPLMDVVYGDDRFVALRQAVDGMVVALVSVDGARWEERPTGFNGGCRKVVFGRGRFLILDDDGILSASADGTAWAQVSPEYRFADISFGPELFVAVGEVTPSGDRGLWFSEDAVNWTKINVEGAWESGWEKVWYQAGLYFARDSSGWQSVSRDGLHWHYDDLGLAEPNGSGDPLMNDLAHGTGHYVAVGSEGQIAASRDGSVWTAQAGRSTRRLGKVAFGDGVFVGLATGYDGQTQSSIRSMDGGLTWSEEPLPEGMHANRVAFGNGRLVAVGQSGIWACEPDAAWTRVQDVPFSLVDVAYGAGRFVAVGAADSVLVSGDGQEWRTVSTHTDEELAAVGYGAPGFLVASASGRIGRSPDGETWTWQRERTGEGLHSVAWGNGRYVALGWGTILVSADGQTWERHRSDAFSRLSDVAYGGGRFLVVGGCGGVFSSVDGRTWRIHGADLGMSVAGVAFGLDTFVLTGGSGGLGLILQSASVAPAGPAVRMGDGQREVYPGESFTLAAAVSGSWPFRYQWFHGDMPLAGATESIFTVTEATYGDAGSYFVQVSNSAGSVRGGPVAVHVSQPPEVELWIAGGTGLRVAPGSVRLEALVNDPDGEVVAVEFYLDDALGGTDTSAPFGWESTELEPGVHQWRARAIDDAGVVSAFSEVVGVRVISPDPLVNWSIDPSGLDSWVPWMTHIGGGYYVRAGDNDLRFSRDLLSWETLSSPVQESPRLILYGDEWYVTILPNSVWRSRDARVWERAWASAGLSSSRLSAGAYGGGRFVMVGSWSGTPMGIFSTAAGAEGWAYARIVAMAEQNGLRSVTYGAGRFVAVGRAGLITWSPDGSEWSLCPSVTSANLTAVDYGNGRFVAVGEGGGILTSEDGNAWSAAESGSSAHLWAVAYGAGAFAAVGENGTILVSRNGDSWESCLGGGDHRWQTVTWAEGRFVAMGPYGFMVRTDATMILDPLRLTPDGRLVCGFAGVAGRNYRLERSEDLIEWKETAAAAAGVHGPMELVDPALPTGPYRFYRVLWTP